MRALTIVSSVFSHLLFSCGGAKTEKSAEQPTDVAGGFGLVCSLLESSTNSVDARFRCVLPNDGGEKIQDSSDLQVEVFIKGSDAVVPVTIDVSSSKYNFTFAVPKTQISLVQIEWKNSNENNSTKKSTTRSQALMNGCDLKKFQPIFISAIPRDGEVELRWQANGDATLIEGYYGRYWEGSDFKNDPPTPPPRAIKATATQ